MYVYDASAPSFRACSARKKPTHTTAVLYHCASRCRISSRRRLLVSCLLSRASRNTVKLTKPSRFLTVYFCLFSVDRDSFQKPATRSYLHHRYIYTISTQCPSVLRISQFATALLWLFALQFPHQLYVVAYVCLCVNSVLYNFLLICMLWRMCVCVCHCLRVCVCVCVCVCV